MLEQEKLVPMEHSKFVLLLRLPALVHVLLQTIEVAVDPVQMALAKL
jgi:hypothetical protein